MATQMLHPAMQMPRDPVLEALGLSSATAGEQDWTLAAWQQATPYDYTMPDPNQAAWCQAQAMIATAWQLQQMANATQQMQQLQAAYTAAAYAAPPAPTATTPRTTPPAASEATPTKTLCLASPGALTSDLSTAPGSPSGDTEVSEQERSENEKQYPLQDFLIPPPPPPPISTKLDLNAIIFEKAKDPASIHLLQLIKGSQDAAHGQEKGRELLGLLQSEPSKQKRNGPLASGAHRRAAVAAREAAAAASAEAEWAEEAEVAPRRRRPRGGRGSRGGRAN